ncbi:MAG: hypothetical protein QOJ42_3267 [Acidobacteriaceae bacterium]|nr:hypothetical protein [Acidobacteriaceae bacterium]
MESLPTLKKSPYTSIVSPAYWLEPFYPVFRNRKRMRQLFSWSWVEAQVEQTLEIWNASVAPSALAGRRFSLKEQQEREKAYDAELQATEREAKRVPRTKSERLAAQERITASFARFSTIALDLQHEAVQLLIDDFLPVGTRLARWARRFDARLSMDDIIQACRNAWTACGLQPLLGERVHITPSILGYSLLYPYSDNYLDRADISAQAKLRFSERFRARLRGERLSAGNDREAALWTLVTLIEEQYPRVRYSQVFDCLLAIHRAQEESIAQISGGDSCGHDEVLRMSCAKGGSSVLADACLTRGWLNEEESRFSFEWGVLLQLGDDLQDVREDMQRDSITLFSRAAELGRPLDDLVIQLLNFSERVGARMDDLPDGTPMFKELLRMSWRSLILGAVAESYEFFTPEFLEEAERCSPFRFAFLRARQKRLTSRHGLYAVLFDILLEPSDDDDSEIPLPIDRRLSCFEADESADVGVAE